jgi:Ca-activated chloride channel homolog
MSPTDVPQLLQLETEADAGESTSIGVLSCERGLLPLVTLTIDATITGLIAKTTITQRFVNNLDQPIEATYIFPLPDHAAVTSFTARIGDRLVRGVLRERAEARDEYDEAIASGRQAAIAEEDRPDCFAVRIGNLGPAEQADLELTLTGPVAFDLGEATFRFPLVVAPRYIPGVPREGISVGDGTAPDTDLVPDASRITPQVLLPGHSHPVQFEATVRIDPVGGRVSELRSALPATAVSAAEDGSTVVTVQPGQRLDRDLILRWKPTGEEGPSPVAVVVPDRDGAEATLSVTLLPPTDDGTDRPARDIVVVLDRSGSMGGWKMVAARRAAARIVDSLTARDRFAVLAFDNTVERPPRLSSSGMVVATDHNRFAAVEFLGRLEERGGTELATALSCALDEVGADPDEGRQRYVVVVTDGQIGDEDHVLKETAARLGDTTIFAIGIDQAVNAGFLRRLAAVGGGRLELVESEDRLDHAFTTIQSRLGRPSLRDLRVHVDDAELIPGTMTPAVHRACYPGAPLVLSARLRGLGHEPTITIRGTRPDDTTEQLTIPVHRRDGQAITSCWARARIRDLEDAFVTGTAGVSADEIVATSLQFGVLSRFTAFVAVGHSVSGDSSELVSIVQPVEHPSGWPSDSMYGGARRSVIAATFGASQGDKMSITLSAPELAATVARRHLRGIPAASLERLRSGGDPSHELSDNVAPPRFARRARDLADKAMQLVREPRPTGAADRMEIETTELTDDLVSVVGDEVALVRLLRDLAGAIACLVADPDDPAVVEALQAAAQAVLDAVPSDDSSASFWSTRPS